MKIWCVVIAIIYSICSLQANESVLMMEDLGISAKSIAAGGIDGAFESSSNIMKNPALMGRDYQISLDMFHTTLLEEISYNTLSLSRTIGQFTLGVGYLKSSLSNMPKTAENSAGEFYKIDTYSYKLSQIHTGFCYEFNKEKDINKQIQSFVVGLGVMHRSTQLGEISGEGYKVDIGFKLLLSHIKWIGSISSLPFLSNTMAYSDHSTETFSSQIATSIHVNLGPFQPMVGYKYNMDNDQNGLLHAGIKWTPFKSSILSILGGYRQMYDLDDVLERITIGLHLNLGTIQLSYAYEQSDRDIYNNENYFSLGLKL